VYIPFSLKSSSEIVLKIGLQCKSNGQKSKSLFYWNTVYKVVGQIRLLKLTPFIARLYNWLHQEVKVGVNADRTETTDRPKQSQ